MAINLLSFAKYNEYGKNTYNYTRTSNPSNLILNDNNLWLDPDPTKTSVIKNGTDTDLTSENIMNERRFKMLVLDWLNDGNPKLFRTPTEGNYMVRLINNSFAPEEKLGRMLHTVSGTAYEIADIEYETLVNFGIIDPSKITYTQISWKTLTIEDIDDLNED